MRCKLIASVAYDGIFKLAAPAFENVMVFGRLPMNFLQRHLIRADRAVRHFRIGFLKFGHAKTPLLGRRPCLSKLTGVGERIARGNTTPQQDSGAVAGITKL